MVFCQTGVFCCYYDLRTGPCRSWYCKQVDICLTLCLWITLLTSGSLSIITKSRNLQIIFFKLYFQTLHCFYCTIFQFIHPEQTAKYLQIWEFAWEIFIPWCRADFKLCSKTWSINSKYSWNKCIYVLDWKQITKTKPTLRGQSKGRKKSWEDQFCCSWRGCWIIFLSLSQVSWTES